MKNINIVRGSIFIGLTVFMVFFLFNNDQYDHMQTFYWKVPRREEDFGSFDSYERRLACHGFVALSPYDHELYRNMNRIYFLETSQRSSLDSRSSCAIESAARFSGLEVIVLMVSDALSLEDPVMCSFHNDLENVHFHHVVLDEIFMDTPIEGFHRSEAYNESEKHNSHHTHLSDVLRMVVMYKYGGWYADLDYLFLKPMTNLHNVFSGECGQGDNISWWMTNSLLNFREPGHLLPLIYLNEVKSKFKGMNRFEIGPLFLNEIVRLHCGLKPHQVLSNINDTHRCEGMTVLHPDFFEPVRPGMDDTVLWRRDNETVDISFWDQIFNKSYGIHFYHSHSKDFLVNDSSKHAYAYLGPQKCPVSYHSAENF